MTQVAANVRVPRRRFALGAAWRQPLAIAGLVIAAIWIVIAVFAPLIAPHDPLAQTFTAAKGPSWSHPFGTDELGRDVFSRVISGSRVSLPIALVLVGLAMTIGSTVGAVAGYFRGVADGVLMRLADLVFANVLTGAVLVEKIFSWPGVGQYAYQAAVNVDVPAIAGVSIFVAAVYVTVNFIVDILYGIIDPRIRVT